MSETVSRKTGSTASSSSRSGWQRLGWARHCPLVLAQEPFQSPLDSCSPRALEKNHIALSRHLTQFAAGLIRIVEKKRGVGTQSRSNGFIDHLASRAAYPNEHRNPALRGVEAHAAVKGLGSAPEFEHLPQHGDTPLTG